MKTSKALAQFLAKAQERDSYWIENAKLDISLVLERERRRANFSYKALAEKLGTSQAYISKIFRGDANLTIETIVKIARSLDCIVDFDLKEKVQENHLVNVWNPKKVVDNTPALKRAIASFVAEDDGITVGRFNLPTAFTNSCNDSGYLNAA